MTQIHPGLHLQNVLLLAGTLLIPNKIYTKPNYVNVKQPEILIKKLKTTKKGEISQL